MAVKPNLIKFLTRRHATLSDHIFIVAHQEKEQFVKLTSIPEFPKNMDIIDGDFYFDADWMNKITEKYRKADLKTLWKFIKQGYIHGEKAKNYARKLRIGKNTNLEKTFWKSVELLKNLVVFLPVTHPLAKAVELNILEILKKKGVPDGNLTDASLEVSIPDKPNTPLSEVKDLKKIKEKMLQEKNFDLGKAIKEHVKKYGFLGYREPFSKGYSESFFAERLKELKPTKPSTLKYKLKFNREELYHIRLMKEFVYFRNYRTEKLYETLYYIEPLWIEIAKKYGLRSTDLGYYLLLEAKALLEKNKKVKTSIIDERKSGHAFLMHNRKISFITGYELTKKKETLNKLDNKTKELLGISACIGKITGIAKIVLRSTDQGKVKENDILVTTMTTPDFVPSMKKASAFITDEGGITCHAAIVAREMKKPCIIGTKIATKVLKDGDLVEVDANANQGIIKLKGR